VGCSLGQWGTKGKLCRESQAARHGTAAGQYIEPMRITMSHLARQLPSVCQVCSRWPAQPVCADCVQRFVIHRWRCTQCAAPVVADRALCGDCLTRTSEPSLQRCVAAVDYDYPWDDLVARFKFRDEPGWASTLAGLMLCAPGADSVLRNAKLVVPVPIAPLRLANRGYNQAWELAKALMLQAPDHGLPALQGKNDALLRIGDAPDQHSLPKEKRLRNLQKSFAFNPAHAPLLAGSGVVLIDDVTTTGTTLQMAARALLQGGAVRVDALTFARA
jgi:ComF family protein